MTFPGASILEQREHLKHGGLFMPALEPMPEAPSDVELVVESPYAEAFAFHASVVQVFPGTGFALTVHDSAAVRANFAPLFEAADSAPGEAGPPQLKWTKTDAVEMELGELLVDGGSDDRPGDPTKEANVFDRVRAMSSRQRMDLARNGGRTERGILMKDTNKTIHTFLVQNKKITADEIRYFAGFRQAHPEALKMIADNRNWMQNPGIVAALVRNPKTPSSIAVRLLDKLPKADVARIARTGSGPRAVVEAAKRKVIGKR